MNRILLLFISIIACNSLSQESDVVAYDQNHHQLDICVNKATNSYEIKTKSAYADHLLAIFGYTAVTMILFRTILFLDHITNMKDDKNSDFKNLITSAESYRKLSCVALGLTVSAFMQKLRKGPEISQKVMLLKKAQ